MADGTKQMTDGTKHPPATSMADGTMAGVDSYKNDARYKKYQAAVEKALQTFESVGEWADIISFLNRLSKVPLPTKPHVHHTVDRYLTRITIQQSRRNFWSISGSPNASIRTSRVVSIKRPWSCTTKSSPKPRYTAHQAHDT